MQDGIKGTITGSPTLERGQCGARCHKGNYYWFSHTIYRLVWCKMSKRELLLVLLQTEVSVVQDDIKRTITGSPTLDIG